MTFRRNLISDADLRLGAGVLADSVAARLRRAALYCKAVSVQIKDVDLHSISRQKQLPYATDLERDITAAVLELIRENWPQGKPIRMLTVTAMNLTDEDVPAQTEMLKAPPKPDEKRARLERAMDAIRQKHGGASLLSANVLGNDIGVSHHHPHETDDDPGDRPRDL
jgi:DNA polymerase-4